MRCTHYENDLALYVEGDLPDGGIPALEAHIANCTTCRGMLSELGASQRAVRELAAAPLDEAALASVRARIASARARSDVRQPTHWRWAVAAGLATVAAGALWIATLNSVKLDAPRAREAETAPSTSPTASPTQPRSASIRRHERQPERERPTLRAERHVSRRVDQHVPKPALSPEDADQLARALVVVSRIESVSDAVREPPPPSPTALVRWATADPNVVIYWRLESNGGE